MNGFDEAFSSEEEVEQALDEFIDAFRDDIESENRKVTVLNGLKLKQMQFAHSVLRYITRSTGATVTYELNEPYKTMGSISVEGPMLVFHNPEWLARVAEFASNTEVYPLAKNRVRMTFTFHDLTRPIE